MSLISLASTSKNNVQQQPFNFKNHFPQPIIVKPHSQVCLVNFYHFRDEGYYRITESNNTLAFAISNDTQYSGYRYAQLTPNKYTGDDLATEIGVALNSVLLQENYTFTCNFTEGNFNANPPTVDSFTISYTNVATPAQTKGGEWTSVPMTSGFKSGNDLEKGTLTITNNDTAGNQSTIVNTTNLPKSAIVRKGLLLHEGRCEWDGIGKCGFAQVFSDNNPHEFRCGLMRNGNSADDFGVPFDTKNKSQKFHADFADIMMELKKTDENQMNLFCSTLNQKRGSSSLYQSNGKGRVQTIRREVPNSFFTTAFNDQQDRMKFIIHRASGVRAFVCCIQKSSDLGATYSDLPDGTGGNAPDGRPVIYSQTIGGVPYTSIVYSTVGVPDGAGGNVAGTVFQNCSIVKNAPYYPFCNLSDSYNHITGIDLTNSLINASTSNAGIGTDQVFQMMFADSTTGNGYDYKLEVNQPAITPDPNINSTFYDQLAFKVKTASGNGLHFDVYTNDLTPIGSATPIAELRCFPNTGANGQCSFVGLSPPQLNPMLFDFDATGTPIPSTQQAVIGANGYFNTVGNLPTDILGSSVGGQHDETLHFNEDGSEVPLINETIHSGLGVDFNQASVFLVDRPSQTDIATFRNAPARLDGSIRGGSVGATIGLTQNVYSVASGVNTLNSDGFPFKEIDDNTIHISIPELSNVKSFEGENENTGKTIKVIPKNEFTQSSTAGSMTFTSNYEDWIDINNQNELHINELTLQVRKPDGTMATSLQPITRATIKIQQDPDIKMAERQNEMIETLQRRQGANQDTGIVKSMDKPKWVAS
jgi:hypothetical protein